jgi:hypothetical protein
MKCSCFNFFQSIAVGVLFFITYNLYAQHYPAGSEGIKAGSLPAPGFYVQDYNSFYYADRMQGFGGAFDLENGFNTFSYVQSPRLLWMSHWKIFGANFGMAVRIPIEYKETTFKGSPILSGGGGGSSPGGGYFPGTTIVQYKEEKFGLADIEVEPVMLSWRFKHFDFSAGYSFWAPTGDYSQHQSFLFNLGQGYWTHSFSLGITWYPDAKETWAVSILNHYDINTAQYSTLVYTTSGGVASEDTTLGDIYTLEWAVSKTIMKNTEVGLTGYYQQQVTATEGPTIDGPTWQNEKIHVAGIGPEICVNLPKWGLSASLRYDYEFSAMDHPQGHLINLSFIKKF